MRIFELSEEEERQINDWIRKQKEKDSSTFTIGERWTYCFTPTGLGTIVKVKDNKLDEEFNPTDVSLW